MVGLLTGLKIRIRLQVVFELAAKIVKHQYGYQVFLLVKYF